MPNTIRESDAHLIEQEVPQSMIRIDDKYYHPERTKWKYHEQRLNQSKWAFRLSIWGCLIGFGILFLSMVVSFVRNDVQWMGIVSGIIIDAVSALVYVINDKANEKISEFFIELTKDLNVERAINLSNEIQNEDVRDRLKCDMSLYLVGAHKKEYNEEK